MNCLPLSLSSSLFLVALSAGAGADVIVVDFDGGGDFLRIQDAVDAASDGDAVRILQTPTNSYVYDGFLIGGKSLSILGPALGVFVGPVSIRNLGRAQTVALSNLRAESLEFARNKGGVIATGCELGARYPDSETPSNSILSSRSVTFVDCVIRGVNGDESTEAGVEGESGTPGLRVQDSRVAVYGGQLTGGFGGGGLSGYYGEGLSIGGSGAAAIAVTDGELFLEGVEVRGGGGGWASLFATEIGMGGDGGDGVVVSPGSSALQRDCFVAAGFAGFGYPMGVDGVAIVGRVVDAPGAGIRVTAPRIALRGEEIILRLVGEPGREVTWVASEVLTWDGIGVRSGVLHAGQPAERIAAGVIPPCGEWTVAFAVPANTSQGLVLQAALLGPERGVQLTQPAYLSTLESLGHPDCAGRFFVDAEASPGGDGLSWARAFDDLVVALAAVPDCGEHSFEIWVAEGTYYPGSPGGFRSLSFDVMSGVHLYGGFAGGETALGQRDPSAHVVVLSGDLDRNDDQGIRSDNAYRVVELETSGLGEPTNVRLDGVTIQGGDTFINGAGIYARGDLELRNCTIRDCYADDSGSALFYWGGDLSMIDCRVIGNRVGNGIGGPSSAGVEVVWVTSRRGGRLSITNTLIEGNMGGAGLRVRAGETAGGPLLTHATLGHRAEIRHCTIALNVSDDGPAGILADDIPLELSNTVLWGNQGSSLISTQAQQLEVGDLANLGYLCVEGLDGTLSGFGHVGLDPRFVDPLGPDGIPGTLDDNLRLAFGSPCADAGANARIACDRFDFDRDGDYNEPLPVDPDGGRRQQDDPAAPDVGQGAAPIVDLGAFEHSR